MLFFASTLFQILVATTAIAVPSSGERYAQRLARRGTTSSAHLSSQPNQASHDSAVASKVTNITAAEYSENWAGANTIKFVTGTFVVPVPREPVGVDGFHSAVAWVGIDGYNCPDAILQTGVEMSVSGSETAYNAWYEWYPYYGEDFDGFLVRGGDTITATVVATSTTSGSATIINHSTGEQVTKTFNGYPELCLQDAEWIVEDYELDGERVPFADFDRVTFTNALADATVLVNIGPGDGTVLTMRQGKVILAVAEADGSTLNVWYGLSIFGDNTANSTATMRGLISGATS
ncbi:peptidase A4 family-domain-containing protein [Cubamyces lactineus]|nr:peptidase A4 family-domain-containing protein [Cubamyces lactineus]